MHYSKNNLKTQQGKVILRSHLELPLSEQEVVSHCELAIYMMKKYLKAKEEELWKLKYFTMQRYNLQKISSKTNQNPSKIL
jgi:hypothetical protein